jgi:hypothetical protein
MDDHRDVREHLWQNQPWVGVGNPCFSEHPLIAREIKV